MKALVAALLLAMSSTAMADLRWDRLRVERTVGPDEQDCTVEFPFVNEGTRAVTIGTMTGSCGCATTTIDRRIYQPGEAGVIRTSIRLSDLDVQHKSITVRSDDPVDPIIKLSVTIKRHRDVRLSARSVQWTTSDVPAAKIVAIEFLGQPSHIMNAVSNSGEFTAQVIMKSAGRQYEVHITPRSLQQPTSQARIELQNLPLQASGKPIILFASVRRPSEPTPNPFLAAPGRVSIRRRHDLAVEGGEAVIPLIQTEHSGQPK